jgi:hypothetical protein
VSDAVFCKIRWVVVVYWRLQPPIMMAAMLIVLRIMLPFGLAVLAISVF